MKKLLIIGAGVEQVEAIKLAKQMGNYVIVTDMNPYAPGIHFADKFYPISTTDYDKNIEIGKKEKIVGVMTVCSETAVPTVAKVAKELNLPSFSENTALLATNKAQMRNSLTEKGIIFSPFIISDSIFNAEKFIKNTQGPWVIKPIDSSGQRGTSLIQNPKSFKKAFILAQKYSNSKQVLIDKYIAGREVHVTMFVIDKKVYFLAFSDRVTLNEKNFGIAVRHIAPSKLTQQIKNKIINICKNAVKAINLENGVSTCEIVIENNKPYLMEIAIRVPGGYLREVAMFLSGIDIIKATILYSLGEKFTINSLKTASSYPAVSVKFISSLNISSKIKTIYNINNFSHLFDNNVKIINFHKETPFDIPNLKSSVGRFGIIITVGNSIEESLKKTEYIFNSLKINNQHLIEYSSYNPNNIIFN